jgi:hypothetical protein
MKAFWDMMAALESKESARPSEILATVLDVAGASNMNS